MGGWPIGKADDGDWWWVVTDVRGEAVLRGGMHGSGRGDGVGGMGDVGRWVVMRWIRGWWLSSGERRAAVDKLIELIRVANYVSLDGGLGS